MDVRERMQDLSPAKRALLLRAMEAQLREETKLPPLVPGAAGARAPLSSGQERLWLVEQLAPGNTAYNLPYVFDLEGPLDGEALRAALNEVVRRHAVLRTALRLEDGQAAQVVEPTLPVELPLVDLSALPAAERDARALELADDETRRPFDLARAPLLRLTLLRFSPERHRLLFTLHHAVVDGWSVGVLMQEIAALYADAAQGRPFSLPEPPVQYADFAVWQRAWMEGEGLRKHLDFWKQKLAGIAPLELPADHPRPPVQTFNGDQLRVHLPAAVADGLRARAGEEGATLFMALLAGFSALLHRYTGQDDVAVGTPIANRTLPEVEGLVGFFVNTLVLRTSIDEGETFRSLLRKARETCLEAYAHQEAPFDKLVEVLQQGRDRSRNPLVQVILALQNAPAPPVEMAGVRMAFSETPSPTSKVDVLLSLEEVPDGLAGVLEYNTDLFRRETVERMAGHLEALLSAALAEPDRPLARLPLLAEDERRVLLDWARGGPAPATGDAIHALVQAQAARTPDAVALVGGGRELTYRELDERSSRLARWLARHGAGPEVVVGVCLNRTPEMVVALLAVLKSGAAYVGLDPAYPPDRIACTLEDSAAPLVVAERATRRALPSYRGTIVDVDDDREAIEREEAAAPEVAHHPERLAYLIYTSGSTGRPKGVAIEHRQAAAMLRWAHGALSADELRGVAAGASIAFDMSVFEIFAPLTCGGTVFVAKNAMAIPELPERGRLTLLSAVPSSAAQLVRMNGVPSSIRTVFLGGEAFSRELADALYALPHVEKVYNGYGPSEDTTYSAWKLVERGGGRMTVGRPVPGSSLYVLDEAMQMVPAGVAGEIHITGAGVSRGYLNRPGLTADRFRPDPFSGVPGARMYRTGDRARWVAPGEVDILGRVDHQVKLRGYRIELGEVEAALRQHPGVDEAVVVVRGQTADDRRLVAYVTARPGAELADLQVRDFVRRRLPEPMIPSTVLVLDEMPRTATGKVDRKLLPAPPAPGEAAVYEPPRTPTEERLAAIWAEVLRLERVGRDANFFELGGQSLLATQAVARIRDTFKVELPLGSVFEAPVLSALAEVVEKAEPARVAEAVSPVSAVTPASRSRIRLQLSEAGELLVSPSDAGVAPVSPSDAGELVAS
ncbi:MAG TPA: amino acid adenylation domain-containing protein [Longimicrobium sp.]|nr:amino acid adenylation domain-containing protein [Longimicrobium sp.]